MEREVKESLKAGFKHLAELGATTADFPSEILDRIAGYLGVTTSELFGEKAKSTVGSADSPDFLIKYNSLSPDDRDEVLAIIEMKLAKKNKAP